MEYLRSFVHILVSI